MSASEKLAELAEKPVLNMFKIGDALPQIVAVVEAAESAADEFTHKWLINALEDLDKALS